MPRVSSRLGRLPAPFALLALVSLVLAPGSTRASEPPPVYEMEWSIVPTGGSLAVPMGATCDAAGNLFVTQRNPQRIVSFTEDGVYRFAWESLNLGCAPIPFSVDLAADGTSWIIDFKCSRLVQYDANRALVASFGGLGSTDGKFNSPAGVAVGPDGSVDVADTFNHRIQKLDSQGNFVLKWGSFGTGDGQFNTPYDVDVDLSGNVYVLDSFNQRVQVFTANGTFLRAFGTPGFGADHLIQPTGLAVDGAGNVYVADTGNNQVVKFGPSGARLCAWGGMGTEPGRMNAPSDVAVDGAGHVFVVDSGNRRIQRFASPLTFDLRVQPHALNVKSSGKWVTAAIEPSSPYTPADIVVASLTLNGVSVDPEAAVDITDVDGDGRPELSVRFSRDAIVATATGGADQLELTLLGTVGSASFTAHDTVRLIGNGDILVYDPGLSGASPLAPGRPEVLELRPMTPNPVRAGTTMVLSYRAPGGASAFVDVIDLSGRRLSRVQLVPGAGLRSARVPLARALKPGVYLARLVQGATVVSAKFTIVE